MDLRVARTIMLVSTLACVNTGRAQTWWSIPSPTTHHLSGVAVMSSRTAIIAGDSAALFKTTDGGISWASQHLVYTGNLHGVGGDTIVTSCVADNGTIAYHILGKPWGLLLPYSHTLRAISATPWVRDTSWSVPGDAGNTHATDRLCAGDNGWIIRLRTLRQYEQTGSSVIDTMLIGFTPINNGPPLDVTLRGVAQTANGAGYIVGDSGTVVLTTDRGGTWSARSLGSVALRGVTAISNESAVIVGDSGVIFRTSNTGTTWERVAPAGLHERLNAVSFVDARIGVAVGDHAMIIKTIDGGATWSRQATITFASLRSVQCYTGDDGANWIAVGDSGTIVQTNDGGASASYTRAPDSIDFGGVHVRTRAARTVMITNTSSAQLTVEARASTPALTCAPRRMIVDAGATDSITVSFAPTDTVELAGVVELLTDATWTADTVHVRGYGQRAIGVVHTDSIVFDSAVAGAQRGAVMYSRGNIALTVRPAQILTPDYRVDCDSLAMPGDSLRIVVTLLRTMLRDTMFGLVITTNDAYAPRDTIRIVVHAVPLFVVDRAARLRGDMVLFPNCLPAGAHASLRVTTATAPIAGISVIAVTGAQPWRMPLAGTRAAAILDVPIPRLAPGWYILQVAQEHAPPIPLRFFVQ